MKIKAILATTAIALTGWVALASAAPLFGSPPATGQSLSGYQLADDDDEDEGYRSPAYGNRDYDRDDEWYQGQRGHWDRDGDHWIWDGARGDQWYQGQPGHWYQEQSGWQFSSTGLVCNNQGQNCRFGRYVPPNGEGMVSRSNPNMFWHCDSRGHHCHWAQRPRW